MPPAAYEPSNARSAMKSAVGWLERYYKAELAWRDAHIEHGAAEKVALEMKAEAKDFKLKFLERENARLRRLVPRVREFELVVRSARVHFVVALSSWARLKAQSRLVLDGTLQWKRSLLFFSTITPLNVVSGGAAGHDWICP